MAYYFSRKLNMSFDEALVKITQTLHQQGFGYNYVDRYERYIKAKVRY